MSCEICGRSACTKSFHSSTEIAEFDNVADKIKEIMRETILYRINRLNSFYDENDCECVSLEQVINVINDY